VPVGQIIALLAEEGDDLSSIEVPKNLAPEGSSSSSEKPEEPKEEAKPAAKEEPKKEEPKQAAETPKHEHKTIKHSQAISPSVARL
jgi:pyruvate/2-oxoglutarate dehydrogenase complex dihydrolipoamide acyltransferase (E2) component